ncbi:MAG TPA: sodium:solute symporter family protein [Burkholderiaceae bacterium]|nr:sodium:solute symporter family protein [Burkholderiaceae bacterium]
MLITAVGIYLILTIGIGIYASTRIHGSKDFMVAGRSLPLYMNLATVFATWFGAETVLSVSATFARDGLVGVPADPFGASAALILVALLFARKFYRMNLLTIGDYYRHRYGKSIEVLTSVAITISYLGWFSANLTAIGLVLWVMSGGAISLSTGIIIGAVIVVIYTFLGGMWAIALTDLVQMAVIIVGLSVIAWLVSVPAGGPGEVIGAAYEAGKLGLFPTGAGGLAWLAFGAAFLTMALGSIPQQDVFQRVTSAKNEHIAVRGTLLGAVLYLIFAFVPMYIAYSALVIDPEFQKLFQTDDDREIQRILPDLILSKTPVWAQIAFFGALTSAILSTSAGALLAPTSLFTENVLRPFMPRVGDQRFLVMLRTVLVIFSIGGLLFALNSTSTMYEMVQNAYKVTLAGAIVPLAAGMYWKRATVQGAMLSIILGIGAWLIGEAMVPEDAAETFPPQLFGLGAAIVGMIVGSLAPQVYTERALVPQDHTPDRGRAETASVR